LYNEIGKIKKHIALRQLIPRATKALQEIKPCWMMSPTSVSQYLNSEAIEFDLCILDEASQMPPENAIASLARCRQFMIVGDVNQLPPSDFFKKRLNVEDEAENYDDAAYEPLGDSILDKARENFGSKRRLLWHYRSRHQALIEFSNKHIYDDSLVVFPSPTGEVAGMGVELIAIKNGIYNSGLNQNEAEAMAQAALKFMKSQSHRSLGLVTLNLKQAELLREKLEALIAENSYASSYEQEWQTKNDGLEKFFVKNLENVQGDERDVIFIGTVYGPDKLGGPVANRFGPVAGFAGRRRLNVLFTRAKEKIVTFTSMTPEDIKVSEEMKVGPAMLKSWLKYSYDGGYIQSYKTEEPPPRPSLIGYVAEKISELGWQRDFRLGSDRYRLDLAVKSRGKQGYVLGLESDGPTYQLAESTRDRELLREEVLKGLGWNINRLWTVDWFSQAVNKLEKIKTLLQSLDRSSLAKRVND
jgi:superfamily I DNA and/or RNA helicase/very-short-patch-repair endonuclease